MRWAEFIKSHMHNRVAADFFTVEVLTPLHARVLQLIEPSFSYFR